MICNALLSLLWKILELLFTKLEPEEYLRFDDCLPSTAWMEFVLPAGHSRLILYI